ncbi:MAG TPA: TIGR04086 family membrane protein [Candidatus Fimadaptatus faecigallinarum]|uniref:TIGR04086 family membrane protein n=1 Tax=Candidatus Fimadaptatus faecigallinarum TaxID=2840814 RepID=A0A9D1S561_9FIRM|nr:TIGR04086 family membrane protein [Candidatus Fimadaptatus faecigallinarum]
MQSGIKSAALGALRGLAVAVGITALGMLALGLMAGYTAVTDDTIRLMNQCLKLASVLLGTLAAVGMGGERGLVKGMAVGALYMLLGLGILGLASGMNADWSTLAGEVLIGAAVGGAAGALLANLPARRSRRSAKA